MVKKPLFFSWEAVSKHCKYNPKALIALFRKGKFSLYKGDSFLLNPDALQNLPDIYDSEIAEYIALAARRNYFDAQYLHNSRLYIGYAYDISLHKLKQNRLLKIVGKDVIFKFEENYGY